MRAKSAVGCLVALTIVSPAAFAQTAAPEVAPEQPATPAAAAPPVDGSLQNVIWLEQPEANDFARVYPAAAQPGSIDGRATIDCLVEEDGRLGCTVVSEDPVGYGFGAATLRISRSFRAAPLTRDSVPTVGGRIRRTIRWEVLD